ncbi:Mariner Mos1 transposase [Araneus ventricosus]|uniref:Mariner Mos1 transposase n=1 Tax=Araneus ventricosus TaxID=182803 RepID=A0A4Y2DA80_ARAVE|nr:Mariner Mos1 transposase [Araneus ventricosus]
MCIVFWGRQDILLVKFLRRGETMNAVRYYETLRKLQSAIQNKRREMLSQGIVLLHANARPHSAFVTQNFTQQFCWEEFDHPPYSPDLVPSDYHLFLNLKRAFGGRRFDSDGDAKSGVQQWLSSLAASFFEEGKDKLVSRYDKCLNNGGKYVENSFQNALSCKNKFCSEKTFFMRVFPKRYFPDTPHTRFSRFFLDQEVF